MELIYCRYLLRISILSIVASMLMGRTFDNMIVPLEILVAVILGFFSLIMDKTLVPERNTCIYRIILRAITYITFSPIGLYFLYRSVGQYPMLTVLNIPIVVALTWLYLALEKMVPAPRNHIAPICFPQRI
jgi:hypothetical protein